MAWKNRMNMWVRAVWKEDGVEEEGTVPSSWLRDGLLYWPNTSNALRAMKSGKVPAPSWRTFPVLKEKLRSESWDECETYDFTTSVETEDDCDGDDVELQRRNRKKKIMKDFVCAAEIGDSSSLTEPPQKKAKSTHKSPDIQIPKPPVKPCPGSRVTSAIQDVTPPPFSGEGADVVRPHVYDRSLSPVRSPISTPESSPQQASQRPATHSSVASAVGFSEGLAACSTPRRSPRRLSYASEPRETMPRTRSPTGWTERLVTIGSPRRSPRRPSNGSESRGTRTRSPTGWADRLATTGSPCRSPRRSSNASGSRISSQQSKNRTLGSTPKDRFPLSVEVFQRKVFQQFAELKLEIRDIKEGRMSSVPGSVDDIPLKATSFEELMVIEESLRSQEEMRKLTGALTRIGGNTNAENARRILNKLMTNEVMALFSLKGKKGKRAFEPLNLCTAVRGAVVKTMGCTDVAAEAAIAAGLKYAPDRQGGGGRRN